MNLSHTGFEQHLSAIGVLALRPLQLPDDLAVVHGWLTDEHAHFWGMQKLSAAQVGEYFEHLQASGTGQAYLGLHDGQPAFLLECYHPAKEPIGEHYAVQPGDLGMHILVAPPPQRIPKFTWSVFSFVMEYLFDVLQATRVVVEPDVNNEKIHVINRRAGFEYIRPIQLPDKIGHLAVCTRTQFHAALGRAAAAPEHAPQAAAAHLQPDLWRRVNTLHVRKVLSEFAHERLIEPVLESEANGWGLYRLGTDVPGVEYRFRARLLSLEHWHIDPDSIDKRIDGEPAPLDSMRLILELRETLGVDAQMLPTYLEEIASTLYGSAYKHSRPGLSAAQLASADFQAVETAMTEGHPCFVANNGRVGFDAEDYRAFAPEVGAPVRLVWLAAHCSRTVFACSNELSYERLMEEELDSEDRERFERSLRDEGLDPQEYMLIPVHPWQWFNKLATAFAPDIATRKLICLGYSRDRYRAQQSIRTLFNTDRPQRHYVKTALSILNMGFMRGLSPYYMSTTPAINDFIHRLIEQDPYLAQSGFSILREVAGVGYANPDYEEASGRHSPHCKMLSALWRESPITLLSEDQRLMTMASLLHIDQKGNALLPELIRASGLDTDAWLARYLECYLAPLLHCFYAHDLAFMPHGENLILVLKNNVPVRAIMKDIGEEATIMNEDVVLSEKLQRLSVSVPEDLKVLSLFTDVFDCIFRFINHILVEHDDYPEERFWSLVADCVLRYQRAHPQLAEKFQRHDLFAPHFALSCLNRLQLRNNRQMIDLSDPAKNLKLVGTLANPIAPFREELAQQTAALAS